MLRILRVLPILALIAAFAGFTQVRLDTDTLSLLPSAVPGVAELQRLNAHLADERTLVLLVEPKDIDNAEDEVDAGSMPSQRSRAHARSVTRWRGRTWRGISRNWRRI